MKYRKINKGDIINKKSNIVESYLKLYYLAISHEMLKIKNKKFLSSK